MPATSVITVRLDPALLKQLKARAREEGRTVSGQVVYMLRQALDRAPTRTRPGATGFGMFAHLEAPELEEFKALRRAVTRAVTARIRRPRRAA